MLAVERFGLPRFLSSYCELYERLGAVGTN
jgi:hypothetical protein